MRLAFLIVAALALCLCVAQAHEYKIGDLEIVHPWTRATPKGAKVAGGYLKISNKGATPDRLVSARFELAARVEIHEIVHTGGTASMRELRGGLVIKPGATVELKPGGYHIMFMDLRQPLEQGQQVKGALTFEKAGTIEVEFTVEAAGAPTPGAHRH